MHKPLLPVDEALRRVLAHARPVTTIEELPLAECAGRVLARDLSARITQPPFDSSAMDGYAIHAKDCDRTDIVLKVSGEAAAGSPASGSASPGTALRIFTGAPVPDGASAVIIQENVERQSDGSIVLKAAASMGANIRPAGQDFRKDEMLLGKGSVLHARALSLAAAGGHGVLPVFMKPKIAVLATGDELVPPGTLPGPGQISASGSIAIQALLRSSGADVVDLGIAGDTSAAIETAARTALNAGADLLITIGGASVGDHDLVRPTLSAMGMEHDFWKIAMRPGKPMMVGQLGEMAVLGLPGNPASSFICALIFAEPLVRTLAHQPMPERMDDAEITADLPKNGPRQHYMRGFFENGNSSRVRIAPSQDSSLQTALAYADCLVVRPPEAEAIAAGSKVTIIRL